MERVLCSNCNKEQPGLKKNSKDIIFTDMVFCEQYSYKVTGSEFMNVPQELKIEISQTKPFQ